MAERRMFAKTIIDSDAFLEMPITSQLLYFHLHMRADDEGFINKPKTLMRMLGSKDDDMNVLITKKFIIPFESGIVVIKHWRIHNYLQKGRYIETKYIDEKSTLELDENNAYRKFTGEPPEIYLASIEKSSIDKNNKDVGVKSTRFIPPTLDLVQSFITENNYTVDADRFINFYESKGWYVGKNKMKDWKAALRTWSKDKPKTYKKVGRVETMTDYVTPTSTLTEQEEHAIRESLRNINA